MNTGNSVRDAKPRCAAPAPDAVLPAQEAVFPAQDVVTGKFPRTKPTVQHVQHIQEIIDKLAAVTRQLSRPGNS